MAVIVHSAHVSSIDPVNILIGARGYAGDATLRYGTTDRAGTFQELTAQPVLIYLNAQRIWALSFVREHAYIWFQLPANFTLAHIQYNTLTDRSGNFELDDQGRYVSTQRLSVRATRFIMSVFGVPPNQQGQENPDVTSSGYSLALQDLRNKLRISHQEDDDWLSAQYPVAHYQAQQYARIVSEPSQQIARYEVIATPAIPTPVASWKPPATSISSHEIYNAEDGTWATLDPPAILPDNSILGVMGEIYRTTFQFGVSNQVVHDALDEAAVRLLAFRYDNRGSIPEGRQTNADAMTRSGASDLLRQWHPRRLRR